MIKLLALLFSFTMLYGSEMIFALPEHHTLFIHELSKPLKNSSQIVIITQNFNHQKLQKEILKSAKQGGKITLIVHNLHGDPLSMVQYNGIHLYRTPLTLDQSILLIDNTLACTVQSPFDAEKLNENKARIRCTEDHRNIALIRQSLKLILRNSKAYLE